MRRWELWQGPDGHSFFPEENAEARDIAKSAGQQLTWECYAIGANPAFRQLYAHLGWGEYRPMLREDGTPYPEDECDPPAS